MASPFDYISAFAQQGGGPFGQLAQSIQTGATLAEMDQRRAQIAAQTAAAEQKAIAERAALENARRQQEAVSRLVSKVRDGTWTEADFVEAQAFAPKDQAEALNKMWGSLSTEARKGTLGFATNLLVAAGRDPAVAKQMLNERAAAERNSGRPAQAKGWEDWTRILDIVPPENVQTAVAGLIAGLDGGKEALAAWKSAEEEDRAKKLAPFTLREQTAKAIVEEARAKFAPEKFLADLNLTQAQINQAKAAQAASRAAERKSGAEAARAEAEARNLAAGIIPVEKRPEQESKFRKEYYDLTKGYQEVKSAYGRILSVSKPATPEDEGPADIALIFNFMKMLDPGSTVMASEYANAANAAGVPDRVRAEYNRLLTGGKLIPEKREAYRRQAEQLFKSAGQQESLVRSGVERIARGYGLNTANIFLEPTETPPTRPGSQQAEADTVVVNGKTYTKPANFTDAQWLQYKRDMGIAR